MGWLWLIIAVIIFAVSMYLIGRYLSDENDQGAIFGAAVVVSFAWPLVVTAIIIFGPFVGLYYIGAKRAEKTKEKSGK